ncbi:MAG TPA: 50S ribosomal protein L11 methyltransferase, partial [Alphaproteobacteria bacterium]|nr:50S ribosomal protein L11 methyltransferase [Alphaproteobacteria bacterium]
ASTAFGTGHHGTTRGCLLALELLARTHGPQKVLDLGCGTGILAFAAAKLRHARTIATDIDPVAAAKAREFSRLNAVHPYVKTGTAAGIKGPLSLADRPYDLIFANILMRPLMQLMPSIARCVRPGGHAILSGLLNHQERAIMAVAAPWRLTFVRRHRLDGWVTLT